MVKKTHGIVHGRTIELQEDLGVADGQSVDLVVTVPSAKRPWGEGIRRSAGGWAAYPEMDAVMQRIQDDRKRERRNLAFAH